MEQVKSLKSLFEQNKESLALQLNSFSLPRDAKKVQDVVAEHLNNLLDSSGEYRQALTQSEEYILLSALNLLNAQQSMVGALSAQSGISDALPAEEPTNVKRGVVSKNKTPLVVGGTAIGGAAGALVFNTWGALIGAIAGTALVVYYLANQESKTDRRQDSTSQTLPSSQLAGSPLKVDAFLSIVGNICENVDGVIDTYRVQVKRIQNAYEQREKPSLQSDYGILLDQIANVCNVCEANKDSVPSKLQNAVSLLSECLENYGLKFMNGKIISE